MHMATYVNSEMFHELGGFRKEMKYSGDYDFFLRALAIEPFARIGRTLACFRRHGDNQSMSITPKHRAEIDEVERQFGPSREWKKQYYLGNKEPHVDQAFQPDFPGTSGWKA